MGETVKSVIRGVLVAGSAAKDPSRGKLDAKSSSSRSISALCASLRNFSLEISAFAVRIIVWLLTRWVLLWKSCCVSMKCFHGFRSRVVSP